MSPFHGGPRTQGNGHFGEGSSHVVAPAPLPLPSPPAITAAAVLVSSWSCLASRPFYLVLRPRDTTMRPYARGDARGRGNGGKCKA